MKYELAVIGAGPAGMAAALNAAVQGVSVVVFDEQVVAGGQIYRSVSQPLLADEKILGKDYYYGAGLVNRFNQRLQDDIDFVSNASVWEITRDKEINVSVAGQSYTYQADKIILANGAQERPVPFPGWTLPGVMTCGSAQILLKSSAVVPAEPLVIAGSGPLLLLITCQLLRAGVKVDAVLDTTPSDNYRASAKHFFGALKGWRYLAKGLGLLLELKRSGIRYISQASALEAKAGEDGRLSEITFKHKGQRETLPCSTLLVHQGVIPNVQLSRSVEIAHKWSEIQSCWHPDTDEYGASLSHPDIYITGDGKGIAGALAAEISGACTGTQVAFMLNKIAANERDLIIKPLHKEMLKQMAIRPFLDELYKPEKSFRLPSDNTVVCRCEEVTAGEIRSYVRAGCKGPNQTKAFGRPGMGPCQGRMCGITVSNLIAEESDLPIESVGYYKVRAPIKPLKLGELAQMSKQ